jgi:hypothetical protein
VYPWWRSVLVQGDAELGSQPAATTDGERLATKRAYVLPICGRASDLAQIGPKRRGTTDGVTDGRTDEQVVAGARRPEGAVAGALASQDRSMSRERHRHNSKLSSLMQSEKCFSVPVTESR